MPKKLTLEEFLESLRLSPRLVIELVVENSEGAITLLERDRTPYVGMWHLPGGFLLKGELINDCISRIARDELNLKVDPVQAEHLGLFENLEGDPRGHLLHYVVRFKLNQSTTSKQFISLPPDTISYQKDILIKLGYK